MIDQNTIARYAPGGDLYIDYENEYGTSSALAIYTAAQTGDRSQVTAAIDNAKYGANLNTSTTSIFLNQIATDPLAAPLASANNILGNTFLSFLKSPWVIAAIVIFAFFALGGTNVLRRRVAKI